MDKSKNKKDFHINLTEIYDRNYKKLQNVLADLGGIIKIVILCAEIINQPYNNYVILRNTITFLCEESKTEQKVISTTINKKNRNLFTSVITQKDLKIRANSEMKNNYLNIYDLSSKQKILSPDSSGIKMNNNNNISVIFPKNHFYSKGNK